MTTTIEAELATMFTEETITNLERMESYAVHEYEMDALSDAKEAVQLWKTLLMVASTAGHQPDPAESEFDFLQRLVMRPPR